MKTIEEEKMNWLCRIGIHDWEIIESKENAQIEHDIFLDNNPDIDRKKPCFCRTIRGAVYYKNKICLKCEKHINKIENKKNKLIKIKNNTAIRQKKANSMLKLMQKTHCEEEEN